MFQKMKSTFTAVLMFAIIAIMAFSVPTSKAVAGELVIYSGRHYADAIMEEFTRQTGIKLTFHRAGSVELYNRLIAEGDRTPADILITVDAGTLERARIAGILHPIASKAITDSIPAKLRAPDNSWVGLTIRTRVIAYNPERVTPAEVALLKRFTDVNLPQFRGRLGIRTGTNVYPQSHAATMIAQVGEHSTEMWLRGLVINAGDRIYPSDMRVVEAIAAGEVDIGLVNNYYVYRGWLDKRWNIPRTRLAYIVPEQREGELGQAFNISGAGIIRTSKNKENAQRFIEFLTSKDANSRIAIDNHEYPANPAAKPLPQMRPLNEIRLAPVPLAIMGRYMVPAIDLIDKVGYR